MHRALVTLVLGLLVVAPWIATAQSGSDPVPLLSDPDGDVQIMAAPDTGAVQPGQETVAGADLVGLSVLEEKSRFRFTLELAGLDEDGSFYTHYTYFGHNGVAYRVDTGRYVSLGGGEPFYADLNEEDPASGRYAYIQDLEVQADLDAGTLTVDVPRDRIVDADGAAPFPGRALTAFYAESYGFRTCSGCYIANEEFNGPYQYDRMPDDGTGEDLPIRLGLEQSGHARLHSDVPFRFSNGEASTFVYTVLARNEGPEVDVFQVEATDAPADWDVRVPAARLTIDAGGEVEVPVVLRTPFGHQHGESESFILEMTSQSEPGGVGRVRLGILYPEIPQPSGHHNTLTVHSIDHSDDPIYLAIAGGLGTAAGQELLVEPYINTLESEDQDDGEPIGHMGCRGADQGGAVHEEAVYCWRIPLRPSLKMGLDFDLEQVGTVAASFQTVVPLAGAELFGEVVYLKPADDPDQAWNVEEIAVAAIEPDGQKDIAAGSGGALSGTVHPTEAGEMIPYEEGGGLQVHLGLRAAVPDTLLTGKDTVELMPGSQFTLPLVDYEDPVDEVFGAAGAVQLIAAQQERPVNPGETALHKVTLRNDGPLEDAFHLSVVGSNEAWAWLPGGEAVTVAAGGETGLTVAVAAPDGATDGERADLVLEARSASDPAARGLLRLVTTVDSSEDHPDDAAAAGLAVEDKDAPGPAWWIALPLAVALAGRRR